jgi:hypothetical protein
MTFSSWVAQKCKQGQMTLGSAPSQHLSGSTLTLHQENSQFFQLWYPQLIELPLCWVFWVNHTQAWGIYSLYSFLNCVLHGWVEGHILRESAGDSQGRVQMNCKYICWEQGVGNHIIFHSGSWPLHPSWQETTGDWFWVLTEQIHPSADSQGCWLPSATVSEFPEAQNCQLAYFRVALPS